MAQAGDIQIGAVLGGTYQITGLLGRGGMGTVWVASHLRLPGKRVAVKVLIAANQSDESYARFRREAEIASRIGHPNIVEVLDWNTLPDGTPYLVLEFLDGETLGARMLRGPMPLDAALDLVRQIGSALHAAHRAGVIHRDLKPDNIFLCPTDAGGHIHDRVKVLDFGISKIKNSTTLQTQEARLLGTPQYMAPEQAQGKNQLIDQRTDLFALGVIVYELLSGRPPFSGENIASVVFKVVFEAPEPLSALVPGLPPHVYAAVGKALAKEREQRQPDILAFIGELTGRPLSTLDRARVSKQEEAFAATTDVLSLPPVAGPTQPGPRAPSGGLAPTTGPRGETAPIGPPPASRRGLFLGLAAVVVLGAGGAAVALLGGGGKPVAGPTSPAGPARAPAPPVVAAAADPAPRAAAPGPPDAGAIPGQAAGAGALVGQAADAGAAAPSGPLAAAAAPDAGRAVVETPAPGPVAAPPPAPRPVAAAPPAPRPVAAPPPSPVKPAARPVPQDTPPDAVEEGAPETVASELREGEQALRRGDYEEALRLGRHSLQTKITPHGYALMARAYCGLRDLSGARAMLQNLRGALRAGVYTRCRRMGFPLE